MTEGITKSTRDRYAVEGGEDIYTFAVGAHYYGHLICEHHEHKLLCTKRTAKSVWLAAYNKAYVDRNGKFGCGESYDLPRRSKIKWAECNGKLQEVTDWQGWMVDADGHQ